MKRRQFLRKSLQTSITLSLAGASILTTRQAAAQLPADIVAFTATQLSAAIRNRDVSAVETMEAYLAHIHRYNGSYNAIVGMAADDDLLSQARQADDDLAAGRYSGWMHGMPHAVKDLTAVRGLPYTSGSAMFADRIAQSDGALPARMRRAGAIFIGKTNVPEFGLGSQSYNPVYGATGSAWNPALTSGGSSGGAAAGLGTHMLPVADGSDMMGSLRNPGAFNNVIGFRPTTGLMGSGNPFTRSLSTAGPMGRNTEDTIRLLHTIAPVPGADQPQSLQNILPGANQFSPLDMEGLRIGWLGDYSGYLAMEPGILDLCEQSLAIVEQAGAVVEPITTDFDMAELFRCWLDLRNWGRTGMRGYYENDDTRPLIKPELRWEIEQSYELSADDIYRANETRRRWYAEINRLFETHDFLVLPTAQVFPYPKEIHWPTEINGRSMDTYHRWMEVVIAGSLAGIPVLNVPVGFDDQGRPMGMQVMAPFAADRKVLEFGLGYELITDYLQQRPTLVPA